MLNDFGKAIRKARIDTGETLSTMAKGVRKTVSFLSAIETGAKKIPMDLIPSLRDYLVSKGANAQDLENLEADAMLANEQVNLHGMTSHKKQAIVAFAKSDLNQSQLNEIMKLLGKEKE
ncbi:TPA: hypothetical protein ACFP31_001084 [Neisseria subflava]|jgi:XRE family transcriptional regulator|nr:MAG TPA: Transcriptional regulator BINDING, PHEROMONE BINDING, REPEAT [Caudoviricetes sp.]